METPVQVRPASDGDVEALSAIWREVDRFHRAALPEMFRAPPAPWPDGADLAALMAGTDSALLVADMAGAVVGFVTLHVREAAAHPVKRPRRYVELEGMGVAPEARRMGVGRALALAAADWAKARDIEVLELSVHAFNAGAEAFYRSVGFAPVMHRMGRRLTD